MSAPVAARPGRQSGGGDRFRLHRAGVLNVWQYDEQVFTFADGRLLLRGANGAGKSKTLEMLLPFALDGDKARITASAKHHTSLLWLMTDGLDGGNRVGYVWVEFRRTTPDGEEHFFTCGVGIRASTSARTATAWHFVTDRRVGVDVSLEDAAGPLSLPGLKEVLGAAHVFDKAADYKAHVGRALFGLDLHQYEEVLRLLYWLRQPQVGEDIEPAKLAVQLSQALPQLDELAVRAAGETFDELTAFGEQIERRSAAADALLALADAYSDYARAVVAERARAVSEALREERARRSAVHTARAAAEDLEIARTAAEGERDAARSAVSRDEARLRTLQDSPESRDQRRLDDLTAAADHDTTLSAAAATRRERSETTVHRLRLDADGRSGEVRAALAGHVDDLRDLDSLQRRTVPGSSVPVPAVLGAVSDHDHDADAVPTVLRALDETLRALDETLRALTEAESAVTRRRAGVAVVSAAVDELRTVEVAQRGAEREADQAERRWEDARAGRIEAEEDAGRELEAYAEGLRQWVSGPDAAELTLPRAPEDITEDVVAGLPGRAREAAAPRLAGLRDDQAQWRARLHAARVELERLAGEREATVAERDPMPPAPALTRTDRVDGRALWQVVDFAAEVPARSRAALEAALQASGLLDAWVRPGGVLLGPDHLDVVVVTGDGPSDGARSLAAVLTADPPQGSGVTTADVERVLRTIGLGEQPGVQAWMSTGGGWRLGPAHGRATKDRAQFIGATARAEERSRRLARLDAAINEHRTAADEAERLRSDLERDIAALEGWVAATPVGQRVLASWTRLAERQRTQERDERENRAAQAVAHDARLATASARAALTRLAGDHGLPTDARRLDALEQQLVTLAERLREARHRDPPLRRQLAEWEKAVAVVSVADDELRAEVKAERDAQSRAEVSRAAAEQLRATVGESVQRLHEHVARVRSSRQEHARVADAAGRRVEQLFGACGRAEGEVTLAQSRWLEHRQVHEDAVARLVDSSRAPGLFEAGGVDDEGSRAVQGLEGHPWGEPMPRPTVTAVGRLATLSTDDVAPMTTRVWRSHGEAASGPAADHQPTVSEHGDLLAVSGQDDAGESGVTTLGARVRAGVDRDRDLLTQREREQFQQHVLGELGDAIRACRRDAEELVVAMNTQLGGVTTSQGIRVRLDWQLRDDVPHEVRAAVALLAQPIGALIPEERATLRDVLHRLIEASRVERPDLSYGEHLAAALDYRTWSAFTIRYTRPEKQGQWERLHRRSPLSQGEQKVLCYLPLFAAAAAHFTSLAGAAPHAPRLVLLDDAFPKIDVRTHPLLFGLLVDLDLDFVITSERLWGDHATVPSLAIYEALRDPGQRGIAQYEYRWDGRVLESVG